MITATLLVTGFLLRQIPSASPVKEVSNMTTRSFAIRSYVWRGPYNQSRTVAFLKGMLQNIIVPTVKLTVYTDEQDAITTEQNKGITDISKITWDRECREEREHARTTLELIHVGRYSSIREFDNGDMRELPRSGEVSLNIKTKDAEFTFLHLSVFAPKPMFAATVEPSIRLYFQCSRPLSAALALELGSHLDLPDGKFDVIADSAADFVQDDGYPFFNRFVQGFKCNLDANRVGKKAWCEKSTGKKPVCDAF